MGIQSHHFMANGETMETVADFIFLGSKITADGDCSDEIKGHLLLGWKAMTHLATATAAKPLQSWPTLCDPIDSSPPAPLSLGFSRQEHWSGLPFPSPMHESESEVTQSCPTLCDPMDCSPPGFSVHGILQARTLEWVAISFSRYTILADAKSIFIYRGNTGS